MGSGDIKRAPDGTLYPLKRRFIDVALAQTRRQFNSMQPGIGKLEARMDAVGESLGLLREEVGDEKDHAQESRAVIHRRLDEQAKQIAHLETTVAISGEIDAQIRNSIATLT
jgi:hypothetical protein